MDLSLIWDREPPTLDAPVILASFDGWTDAGSAGSTFAAALRQQFDTTRLGHVDPDLVFDYRDRRPTLEIDRGVLGEPEWPEITLDHLRTPAGRDLLLLHGGEPDFAWRGLTALLARIASEAGAAQYVGLGSVPGPVPHTRPVRVIATSNDEELLERLGRPHERVVVPASQVVLETAMRDAGLTTLGLWARVPHYVGGEYPAATLALGERLQDLFDITIEPTTLELEMQQQRSRLDAAAEDSPEITEHIQNLEQWYDADDQAPDPVIPTGDQLAADFERFLRDRPES